MPSFFEILKVIALGIIEGITEWLPISSTGHLLIFNSFTKLNVSPEFWNVFLYVIQLGAILAVVILFWKKIFPFQFADKTQPKIKIDIIKMWLKVVVACIPGAIVTLIFGDLIDSYLSTPIIISIALIFYGVVFIVVEKINKNRTPKIETVGELSFLTALYIGLFQTLSVIPGTSRSGATIIGALILGVSRTTAAEFTFFLAIPVMLGMSILKIFKFGFVFTSTELIILAIGCIVAFVVSLLVVKLFMKFIKKHDYQPFGWYRIGLGIVIISLVIAQVI